MFFLLFKFFRSVEGGGGVERGIKLLFIDTL